MIHTKKCLVCNGTGKIIIDEYKNTMPYEIPCRECGGRGWIVVDD